MNRFHRWYCSSPRWRTTVRERLLPWVLRDLELGDRVLEVGSGPGITTRALLHRGLALTSVEIDGAMATGLARSLPGAALAVVQADGAALPFDDGAFSAALCFTMLHHVPSVALQDRLLHEVYRVVRPGGVFAGSDSTSSVVFRLAHLFDTMLLVEPGAFAERLQRAGFIDVRVRRGEGAFRFAARRPGARSLHAVV